MSSLQTGMEATIRLNNLEKKIAKLELPVIAPLIGIVRKTSSPSAAEKQALKEGFSPKLAYSCWALAVIKRDDPEKFKRLYEKLEKLNDFLKSWFAPIIGSLGVAIDTQKALDNLDSKWKSIAEERKKLPPTQQPYDAPIVFDEYRKVGYPFEPLGNCFQGLIEHYGKSAVKTILHKAIFSLGQSPGFGQTEPQKLNYQVVSDLLAKEDPKALELTIEFIVTTFPNETVDLAWKKATPPIVRFCDNQIKCKDDDPDEWTCMAHMERGLRCPYKSAQASQEIEYPCLDYRPLKD